VIDVIQEAPQTVFLSEDEASLYLQATTSMVWAPQGQTPVVRADPGRAKVNFYGTLNLYTGGVLTTRTTEMNAETTAQHLEQILSAIPEVPIVLFWDHAPWHSGPAVREVLQANPRLQIIFYPVAAPELNPQEHVWKATRKAVSHNHTMPKLPELADRFEQHLVSNAFESSFLERYGLDKIRPMFN
jgi:transposase